MIDLFRQHHDAIDQLCVKHRVARLEVFGSASDGDFDESRSDVDLLVEFVPRSPAELSKAFFGLHSDLEALFGRRVDLLTPTSIRNRFLKRSIDKSRRVVYAA